MTEANSPVDENTDPETPVIPAEVRLSAEEAEAAAWAALTPEEKVRRRAELNV